MRQRKPVGRREGCAPKLSCRLGRRQVSNGRGIKKGTQGSLLAWRAVSPLLVRLLFCIQFSHMRTEGCRVSLWGDDSRSYNAPGLIPTFLPYTGKYTYSLLMEHPLVPDYRNILSEIPLYILQNIPMDLLKFLRFIRPSLQPTRYTPHHKYLYVSAGGFTSTSDCTTGRDARWDNYLLLQFGCSLTP